MSAQPKAALPVRDHIHYPDSDGKPMGETPAHVLNMRYATDPIFMRFDEDPMVYVAANMFLYYERGSPRKHVSPDLFVVKGIAKKTWPGRRSYRTWEEDGKGPDAAIEFTSKSTRREDMVTKKAIYRKILKVREYFLFDPYNEYLRPRLQGFRLANTRYLRIKPMAGRLPSEVLGLHLEADGELLRYFDPVAGRRLPISPEIREALKESEEARQQSEEARQESEDALRHAEEEAARLRRELEALRSRLPKE